MNCPNCDQKLSHFDPAALQCDNVVCVICQKKWLFLLENSFNFRKNHWALSHRKTNPLDELTNEELKRFLKLGAFQ